MLRCLRYLQMFQGKNPWKILPIDFNRSEITDIVILVWNSWSSCRVHNPLFQNYHFLGGLSLHLNHLIASRLGICYRQFGTLPIGIFLSNLDSRQLDTSLMTSYGHFWHMSNFGDSRAVLILLPKYGALRKSKFSRWRSNRWLMRLGVLGGQITGLHDGTIILGVRHT